MCVCVCVCIYGGVCVCVCVGLCVLWVAGGIISSIFEAELECLEDLPLFVYFGMKATQRAVPAWTCKTRRKEEGCWSVRSE